MERFEEHTFAICAYKESPYLEACVKSLKEQKIQSDILIATATPNKYIEEIAKKYNIPLYVRDGKPDIQEDWNYAYSKAKTRYITISHQDDVYDESYSSEIKKSINKEKRQLMFFTDYREIKNGEVIPLTVNLKIKKIMLFPLRFKFLWKSKVVRNRILSLGSPICCPAVTFNKKDGFEKPFTSTMKCSLDWDTWYKFAKETGQFVYINKELVYHRIHEESETTNSIENNVRQNEDYEMFRKFWPKSIASLLSKLYSKSLDSNKM